MDQKDTKNPPDPLIFKILCNTEATIYSVVKFVQFAYSKNGQKVSLSRC